MTKYSIKADHELLTELHDLCIWNPDDETEEPKVEVDRTKLKHSFKRWILRQDPVFAKDLESAGKETLYNVVKNHPLGSLLVLAHRGSDVADKFVEVTKKGLTELGQYGFLHDNTEELIEAMRKAQHWQTHTASLEIEGLAERLKEAGLPEEKKIREAMLAAKELKEAEKTINSLTSKLAAAAAAATTMPMPEFEVEATGEIPSGSMKMASIKELFPDIKLKVDFEIPTFEWEGPHPDVPKIDPHYIFRPLELLRTLYSIATNQRMYIHGHTGSGKTTLIEQVAARIGFPFYRINFDSEITRMDLIGRDTLVVEDGKTVSKFVDGILPRMMSSPGIGCFDEIDFCRPDVAYVMQAATEGNALRITEDGDRIVKPHPMFRMFATGNTVGQGDENGMYQGARPQSLAFLDRFTIWLHVDYMNKDQRKKLIENHFPLLSEEDTKKIVQYSEEHLAAFKSADITQSISPRGMLAVARATLIFNDVREALNMTVLDKANNDDRQTIQGLIQRVCG